MWHPFITQLVFSVSTGSQQQVLVSPLSNVPTGSFFLPSVEDNAQDSEKKERGLAFCGLQELESGRSEDEPPPQATAPPGGKWEGLRITAVQTGKVRVRSRLQSRRIQDNLQETDPLDLPCPTLVSSIFPLTQGQICFW